MLVKNTVNLQKSNFLDIPFTAEEYYEIENLDGFDQDFQFHKDLKILGQGSNLLVVAQTLPQVLQVRLDHVEIIKDTKESVEVKVGAGVDWPSLVEWAVDRDYSGIENMAYIPGTVGGAVYQNIAAYGQDFKSVCVSAIVYNIADNKLEDMDHKELGFTYRNSRFKESDEDNYIILEATIRLSKTPQFDTSYNSTVPSETLTLWLEKIAEPPYTSRHIATAITNLRKYKLPDPAKVGTVGSFFKNPFITKKHYLEIKKEIPELMFYPTKGMKYSGYTLEDYADDDLLKIPAGHVVDEAGWKGKWIGNVGTHKRQALCIITNKKASGQEVLDYSQKIQRDVKEKYNLELEPEVEIWD